MMASVSYSHKPTPGGAIHQEQIQKILGGIVRQKSPSVIPLWRRDIKYFSAQALEPQFAGGTREKKMLSWEDDYNRGHKRDKNARARREKHRPSDHTTIRRMDLH